MIDVHHMRDLRWWYGDAQVLFESSPVTAMMEQANNYSKGAILDAGRDYGIPGKRQLFYGADAGKKAGKFKTYVDNGASEYNAIRNREGKAIGYYDAQTVDITGDTRGGAAPTDDEADDKMHEARTRYGKMSRRTLEVARKGRTLERVLAAYCGELGEKYAVGVLVPEERKKERKAKKKSDRPELTTGIEAKEKPETEVVLVRRKGPGRIAALYHLTESGQALLAARAGKSTQAGMPEVAMRALITNPDDDVEYRAAMAKVAVEALELLASASTAYSEVIAEEPRAA